MAKVEYEMQLDCSAEGLFDFLIRPANLLEVMEPSLGVTFNSAPPVVEEGSILEFQMITFGQVVKMTHRISKFTRPQLVIEEQISGPMKSWQQRHEYEEVPGGVIKRDIVEFQGPGGLIGLLVTEDKIREHLADGFYFREQKLRELIRRGDIS